MAENAGSRLSSWRTPHVKPDAPRFLSETLGTLEDPRVDRTKPHSLTDILVLAGIWSGCRPN